MSQQAIETLKTIYLTKIKDYEKTKIMKNHMDCNFSSNNMLFISRE